MLPWLQSLSGLAEPPASVLILLRDLMTHHSCESKAELLLTAPLVPWGFAELGRAGTGSVGCPCPWALQAQLLTPHWLWGSGAPGSLFPVPSGAQSQPAWDGRSRHRMVAS